MTTFRLSCMPYAYESNYVFSKEYEWRDQDSFVNAEKIIREDINTDPEVTPHIVLSRVAEVNGGDSPFTHLITDSWIWCPAVSDFLRIF